MIASRKHQIVYQEIADLLKRHAVDTTALEVLAIAANLVGKLIAMQDQNAVTSAQALDMVQKNIELGNQEALFEISQVKGSA